MAPNLPGHPQARLQKPGPGGIHWERKRGRGFPEAKARLYRLAGPATDGELSAASSPRPAELVRIAAAGGVRVHITSTRSS